MAIAASNSFSSTALAVNCTSSTSNCIRITAGKPDNVAKCTAAGESCQKTGVFVGPYSGTSYTGKKSGGCSTYIHTRACY
jgi:hypothetical protein